MRENGQGPSMKEYYEKIHKIFSIDSKANKQKTNSSQDDFLISEETRPLDTDDHLVVTKHIDEHGQITKIK